MSKEISTGIDKIMQRMGEREEEQSQMQWRDIRNKLDSLLLSTNVLKSDEARRKCLEIDNMEPESRREYISTNWGPNMLNKVDPLLYQLSVLENSLAVDEDDYEVFVEDPGDPVQVEESVESGEEEDPPNDIVDD